MKKHTNVTAIIFPRVERPVAFGVTRGKNDDVYFFHWLKNKIRGENFAPMKKIHVTRECHAKLGVFFLFLFQIHVFSCLRNVHQHDFHQCE